MIEIWAVIVLIVSIIIAFVGAYLALAASQTRKPLEQLNTRVEGHESRLGHLERRDAAREQQIGHIMQGIDDLKQMFQRHEDKS